MRSERTSWGLSLATIGNAVGGGIFVGSLKYGHVVRGGA